MGSAVKAAEQLSRRHEVLAVTTGRTIREDVVSPTLRVISSAGLLLPDPVNYVISPQCLLEVVRRIRSFQPDVVIVNKFMFFTSLSAPIARWLGKPTVIMTDTYPGLNWFPRNRLVAGVMWLYARLVGVPLLRSADRVVLLHGGLVATARRYGLQHTVIHNGIDLEEVDRVQPAADLSKPEGEFWLAYVGRLESVKGYDFLLSAVERLRKKFPGLRTFFVGATAPSRPAMMAEAERAGVTFLGFRDDVLAVLKHMDLFCLPSLNEGLPNALMEAMATRCACVASAVGGVRELVSDGEQGLLTPPGDVDAIEVALARLLDDRELRLRLGRAARRRIESEFDWRLLVEEYDRLFEELTHPDTGLSAAGA